ncbi:class A beta-lactamase [Neokomagataea tanensis]|uniref:class A beta-lactamase n=1 Tax=Neokomagataea TaxID=1223423 RepID=UPI0014775266|nr:MULTISPECIES: class A beta-lactamase [Neokomagataea]
MINRRNFIFPALASALLPTSALSEPLPSTFTEQLHQLEHNSGGKLGVCALDTRSGRQFGWRMEERFCHCSTFKLSLAALTLRESDAGRLNLQETLPIERKDIVAYSPIVEKNLDKGRLSIFSLAEAIQTTSDNAAANILLSKLGGPEAVTRFWRDIGDNTSRLDGYEPTINVIPPGTVLNSTTPKAMAATVQKIVLGNVLKPESRSHLLTWMNSTTSGLKRIRASLPQGWTGYDKTGSGMRPNIGNKTNDLALLVPPDNKSPLIVSAYFENPEFSENIRQSDEDILKKVGEISINWQNII